MATQAFRIVSHYEPENDIEEPSMEDRIWSAGPSFGPSERARFPPRFIRQSGNYDELGRPIHGEESDDIQFVAFKRNDIGSWYKNMPRTTSAPPTSSRSVESEEKVAASPHEGVPKLEFNDTDPAVVTWPLKPPTRPLSSSLPELLARAPPPLASEEKFIPPVWTSIGPSNRGYGMLQRRGWMEGQPLGIGALTLRDGSQNSLVDPVHRGLERLASGNQEDPIDLTEDDDEHDSSGQASTKDVAPPHTGHALLTPLPTILKSDKSGIGSKKAFTRTITNTAEALRLAEEAARYRKRKRNPANTPDGMDTAVGARMFARRLRTDEEDRAALLAYMKS
ncbi:hypothetical protein FRB99_002102 [Tulasnella sp. 403]|nr:hypothetical protein FRB99_002102 [Tulasnella sp. 403]